ncbi:hypothetical protein WH52_06185 [Tenacibaculum holothuriorum]|uniref:Sensor of ECF-type sigma factor n=1 Tax=Tenacibaculum holothuriorum TaxID=1635173 RepID=A0A1Y2PDM8_9FLAO|nr:sensor of ECF-type sigma factor [Tenacibaculum holothuriorum]OSY88596.1 hypothetical protein WH52_06185 [Tenacibaculum holothuriorum]
MKKITYILIFLISFSASAQVKYKKESREKIRALKVGILTEKLDLTSKEAEKFWPIYNKYDKELNDLRIEEKHLMWKQIRKNGDVEALTEKQSKEIVLKMFSLREKVYKMRKDYYKKLLDVLPYKKIIQLEIAEKDFHRKLIGKLRHKKRK